MRNACAVFALLFEFCIVAVESIEMVRSPFWMKLLGSSCLLTGKECIVVSRGSEVELCECLGSISGRKSLEAMRCARGLRG